MKFVDRLLERASQFNEELLSEGLSPVLFRREGLAVAIETVGENRFVLTTVERFHGLRTSEPKKLYFLSCSRTKSGGYMIDPAWGSVTYVLDGARLAQRYSGSPMDYWGPEMRNPKYTDQHQRLHNDESEDRVYSDQPFIPNASAYIREVHCFVDPRGEKERWQWMYRKLYIACARRGLPLYLHTDASSFVLLNKSRAVPGNQLDSFLKAPGPDAEDREWTRKRSTFGSVWQDDKAILDAVVFLWKSPVKKNGDELIFTGNPPNKRVWDFYRYLPYDYNRKNDLKVYVANVLANNRKRPEITNGFLQTMRQAGFSDLDSFFLAIAKRYYPEIG